MTVAGSLYYTNTKIAGVLCMCEIPVFDRKVWFANCQCCIKRWAIGQYTSGYMGCRFFPVIHILLLHCHQYQIHCSMTILYTYTVCYNYITVGVGYLCYYTELRMSVE